MEQEQRLTGDLFSEIAVRRCDVENLKRRHAVRHQRHRDAAILRYTTGVDRDVGGLTRNAWVMPGIGMVRRATVVVAGVVVMRRPGTGS